MLNFIIIVFVCCVKILISEYDCTIIAVQTSDLPTKIIDETGNIVNQYTLSVNQEVGQSLCYLGYNRDGVLLRYVIRLNYIHQNYSTRDRYDFAAPKINAVCTCHCPLVAIPGVCSHHDKCGKTDNCVQWSQRTVITEGCKVPSTAGGTKCCALHVSKAEEEIYTAYEIHDKSYKTEVSISLTVYEHDTNRILPSSPLPVVFNSNSNTVTSFERTNVSLQMDGISVENNLVMPGIYFSKRGIDKIYVSERGINSKNTMDLDKLGWLKVKRNGDLLFDSEYVNKRFQAKVRNCENGIFDTSFIGVTGEINTNNTLDSKYKNSIKSAVYNDNGIASIIPFNPVVGLNIMQNDPFDMVFSKHTSLFVNFIAKLFTDKNSNRFLNITFEKASGLMLGNLTTDDETEHFKFYLEEGKNSIIQPVITKCKNGSTSICIKTIWSTKRNSMCHVVDCSTKYNTKPSEVNETVDHVIGEKDSLLDVRSWLKYANPKEWFNGVKGTTEGIIIAVIIVLLVIIVAVFTCIIRCVCCVYDVAFCRCFCCKKLHRKRNEVYANSETIARTQL